MEKLNRSKFLNAVAERTGAHRRDVEHIWENSVAVIQDAIKKGGEVSITGFGKFKQRVRKAGVRRNPQTGESVKVPSAKLPRFLPAKQFRQYVGGQLKQLPSVSTRPLALAQGGGNGSRQAGAGSKASARGGAKVAAKGGAQKPAAKAGAQKAAPKAAQKVAPKKAAGGKAAAKVAPKKAAPKKAAPKKAAAGKAAPKKAAAKRR